MSEFWRLVEHEFGSAHGRLLVDRHVLPRLGDRTGAEVLADRGDPREVWQELCRDMDVPPDRWLGEDLPLVERPQDLRSPE